jgi:hypothetical protein
MTGCASDQPPDPFVGTWTDAAQSGPRLIIEKRGDDYLAVASKPGATTLRLECSRNANTLTALTLPAGFLDKPQARYDPETGELFYTPFGVNVTLTRISTSSGGTQ